MLGGSSTNLEVRVDGNVDPYERAMQRAQRATSNYERSLESLNRDLVALEKEIDDEAARRLQQQYDAYDKVGRGMVIAGGAMLVGAGLAAKAAMDWESAWAGVEKTVDGTPEEMAALEGSLRNLATTLPATHEEIAAVAEAAGQLGIAREDITQFTRTMVAMGETTNMTAEDAATSIAQFMNVMRSQSGDVDNIASTIVELGNKGATTEAEITAMAQRLSGAGQLIGASEADVLGLAAAMANLGIQAELGGGATQRVMIAINTAVKDGGSSLENFAQVSGVSADQFAQKWSSSPVEAFDMLLQGLGRVQAGGGNVVQVLDDLGITGTHNLQVMLRLAGAGDELTTALSLANDEWVRNSALTEEANKRYATTESRLQVARNQLNDVAIDIGASLLPAIVALANGFGNLASGFRQLPGPIKAIIGPATVLSGVILVLGGAFMMAIPKIAAFNAAVSSGNLGAGLTRAGGAMQGVASFLMGPWGLAFAAATVVLSIFAMEAGKTAREIDAFKATLDETGAATQDTFMTALDNLSSEGWLDYARDLGIGTDEIVAAVTEGGAALDALEAKVQDRGGSDWNPFNAEAWTDDADQFIENIRGQREGMAAAQEEGALLAEGQKALAGSTGTAADAAQGQTAALEGGADAAGALGEELTDLGEALDDLAGDFLSEREAGRSVRETLRSITEATKAYREEHGNLRGAFRRGTESGDQFEAQLDDLAGAYQDQIAATSRVSMSERKTMQTYRESRANLVRVAQQLGMTKAQAQDYAKQVLGTPEFIRTMFQAQTGEAISQVNALDAALDRAAANRQARIDITTHIHTITGGRDTIGGLQQAGGGPVYGSGGKVSDDVPLMASHGEHVWSADEVEAAGGHGAVAAMRREVLAGRSGAISNEVRGAARAGGGSAGQTVVRIVERLPERMTIRADAGELGEVVLDVVDGRIGDHNAADSRPSTIWEGVSYD